MTSQNEENSNKAKNEIIRIHLSWDLYKPIYTINEETMRKPLSFETILVQLEEDELRDTRPKVLNLDALPDLTAPDEDTITLTKDSLVTAACDLEYRSLLASSVGLFCIVTGSLDELNVDSLLLLTR